MIRYKQYTRWSLSKKKIIKKRTQLVILTPSAISKSGAGLLLQLETTILSPTAEAVTRKLS